MSSPLEDRLAALEQTVAGLARRLDALDAPRAPALPPVQPAAHEPSARSEVPATPPVSMWRAELNLSNTSLEELLGGRVLGALGGLAVLLGIVFFVGLAIHNGWIDEPTRVALAFLASFALLGGGALLYERRGRTQAAAATVGAGIAGAYASLVAATTLYHLMAAPLALLVAGGVGAVATGLAVRWNEVEIGFLGIFGAILAPVLVDAGTSGVALLFMAVALTAAVAVGLQQRWEWLAAGAFLFSAPQLLDWLHDNYRSDLVLALSVLVAFWALYAVAALGYDLAVPTEELRASSSLLLVSDSALVAGAGYYMLGETGHHGGRTVWIAALAVAYLAIGVLVRRREVRGEIGPLVLALGLALSAAALALALDGPALVVAWSAEAAVLAWIGGRTSDARARLAAAAFLVLAACHVLAIEARPDVLRDGANDLGRAAIALFAVAIAALVAARFERDEEELRTGFEVLGAGALVYLGSAAVVDLAGGSSSSPGQTPQLLLSAFWGVSGLAGLLVGLLRDDVRFRTGGLALLGLAVVKVFLYDLGSLQSIYRVLSFIALGLLLLAAAYAYQRARLGERD